MRGRTQRFLMSGLLVALISMARPAGAQTQGRGVDNPEEASISPAEVQRMFDAYALVQAEEQLKLGSEQYARFLPRFKALQDIRRRAQAERGRLVQELRRLSLDPRSDEGQLRDRLKALDDLDVRTAADARKALEAIDQVLDVRQQARFRVFEEAMERRKIELVIRARLNNRLRQRGGEPR